MNTKENNRNNDLSANTTDSPYVIGIGASAGGLDAINSLFEHLIPLNASFIIIQHLPADFKSNMAMLLSKHSKLNILEVKDNMVIEPASVYVMTERKNLVVKQGRLVISDGGGVLPNNSIDVLLESLAKDKGDKSIAIILSGANDDGTKGAEAIKNAGGMVIVQDPTTAQFGVMPNSVIASGNADAVLAPELISNELADYMKQDVVINQLEQNDASLKEILDLISSNTQLDFTRYKRATIMRRIARRLAHNNIHSLKDYILFIKDNRGEIDILTKEFMISVTNFFRDSQAFELVKEKVIPEIIQNKLSNGTLKIWIVGCATGEEAYSIAILIREYLTEINKPLDVKIFASDIDQNALALASKGIYPESIVQDVSEERISRFFHHEGNKFRINEQIRSMMIFAHHDVTKHPPYYKLDFISCRNVLIYMNPELQTKVLSTLHYCLNLNGYLFLGPSENIGSLKMKMSETDKKWKIYKNIQASTNLENGTFSTPRFFSPISKPTPALRSSRNEVSHNIKEIIHEAILKDFGYAGVCVDESFKIVQTFGEYNKYLLPDMFNFNLLEILPKELSIATGVSLRKAVKEDKELKIKGINFEQKDTIRSVDIVIKPLSDTKPPEKIILVLFNEQVPEKQKAENIEDFHKESYFQRYTADLEAALKEKDEKLQEAYDALEECNNNAQTFNEELISGNEELQSTNEEVQSINEELQTVNNQYQGKIKELAELNDDLNNYFRSTENSQIYADRNLIIRKFTPPTMKEVNLKESDVGRSISDISTNIKFSTFIEDIHAVIESSITSQKEIQTTDEKWYQMKIIPYIRQEDNIANGVIITFNDITSLKILQKKIMKVNQDHDTFIYAVSHDLKAPASNIEALIATLNSTIDSYHNSVKEISEIKEISDLISFSVKKLKDTISELSDITKIEQDSSDEIKEALNVKDIFNEVKLSIDDILQASKAKITVDFKEQEIYFSKKNFRSILLNLLTNAVKYKSPERDPEIKISTQKSGNYIVLSVEDNGIGMSIDDQSKIFSKFKRVNVQEDIKGSGIGLFLLKKIITNAEGKIRVESEEGKGSVFTVCFKI